MTLSILSKREPAVRAVQSTVAPTIGLQESFSPARAPVRRPSVSPGRRLAKEVERRTKRMLRAVVSRLWPAAPYRDLPAAASVRRILFVRVNFRIGNTVLATALLPALRARFPLAVVDVLAADSTSGLLDGLGFGRVHRVSRGFLRTPWRALSLLRELRRQSYDLAVDGGMGSYSGTLYARLSGARARLGRAGSRFLTTGLPLPRSCNVYETAPLVTAALGVDAPAWPHYRIAEAEAAQARSILREFGLGCDGATIPFVGIFAGGHQEKRWPRAHWIELLDRLDQEDIPTVVFVGPEERDFVPLLLTPRYRRLRVVLPGLRKSAAIMAHATVLVTPDSGPMHLAAALGVPVVAVVETERSLHFIPPGGLNQLLMHADPGEVAAAVSAHPAWMAAVAMAG